TFDYNKVVHLINDYVVEDLSNWYIRRNRKRFRSEDLTESKKAVYKTTYDTLVMIAKMTAPIAPFISEELFKKLTDNTSIQIDEINEVNKDLIDEKLEEKMDLGRKIVTLGRASREKESLKVRQPLHKIVVDGDSEEIIGDLTGLIKEELNIKEV